jgi:hypothetical protein
MPLPGTTGLSPALRCALHISSIRAGTHALQTCGSWIKSSMAHCSNSCLIFGPWALEPYSSVQQHGGGGIQNTHRMASISASSHRHHKESTQTRKQAPFFAEKHWGAGGVQRAALSPYRSSRLANGPCPFTCLPLGMQPGAGNHAIRPQDSNIL